MNFLSLKFEGGRVVRFQDVHLTERYVAWLNDPEVVRFSEQRHSLHTLASCRRYFESFKDSSDCFLAIEADDPELGHIGNIGVAVDTNNDVGDVSIIVGEKKAWRTGLASKAWCCVVNELLDVHGLRKVTAGTMATNDAMLRLMLKSKMQIEATRRRQLMWEGREVDMVYAAIFGKR
jgi:RimJ/RimL family protein N-acetyltransferase